MAAILADSKRPGYYSARTFRFCFNLGNLVGPFTVDDVLALGNRGNSYSGSFDFKQYDISGNLLQEVTGTIVATRIGVN